LDGLVPWEAIEDRARDTLKSGGWASATDFIGGEAERFLDGYRRDLLQTQPVALEVWVEKDALSRVCHRAAFPLCVPVVVARGFSSVSYVRECHDRVRENAAEGRRTVILYYGDLDPSGCEMLPSMLATLQGEMGLGGLVEGVRCALTPEQVETYGLPRNPDALKATDSRARKYCERFGDLAVELDALPPADLEGLVRSAIESRLDMSLFEDERRREAADVERIAAVRDDVRRFIGGASE
ncbi:MAG: hypothetical protein ACRELB_12115, partial [Polyangiaceae bacterium]